MLLVTLECVEKEEWCVCWDSKARCVCLLDFLTAQRETREGLLSQRWSWERSAQEGPRGEMDEMDSNSVVKPLFQFFSRSYCWENETETGLHVSLKSSEGAFFSCKGGRLLFSDKSMKPLLPFSIPLPLLPNFLKTAYSWRAHSLTPTLISLASAPRRILLTHIH